MPRGDHTFAISLAASVALHAAIAVALIRDQPSIAPPARTTPTTPKTPSIYIDDRHDASEEFGVADGAGDAANARPGDERMSARNGDQTQAFLSRDPVGPGSVGDDPSMSVLPRVVAPPLQPQALATLGAAPRAIDLLAPTRLGNDQTPLVRMKHSPLAVSRTAAGGGAIGSHAPPADPAIMSDSESDPFAAGMALEFRDGSVDARLGRKVKTVRPKLTLAARIDLMSSNAPSMTVRLTIDAEGAVRKVDIVRSSGSAGADQAVKVALYQWWVEPKRDDAGRPVASAITFPIVWR